MTSKITDVSFKGLYNHPITLPKNTRRLKLLLHRFNYQIILPKHVIRLRGIFRQPIILTPNILYLHLDQHVDDMFILTENIAHLTFGDPDHGYSNYISPIKIFDSLPNGLKKISNGSNEQIKNLPNTTIARQLYKSLIFNPNHEFI